MSEYEYLLKRQAIAEQVVRALIMTVMEMMPPSLAERVDRLGWNWDKEIDALDAELHASIAAQAATATPTPTENKKGGA